MANDDSILGRDREVPFEEQHHSLLETGDGFGYEGFVAEWQKAGLSDWPAMLLADAQACIQGADAISKVLGADLQARVFGDECAGIFERIDNGIALDLHIGLQRLTAHSREALERFLDVQQKVSKAMKQ